MIYNNSTDPIEIKKISLKVWTLRDQIEAVIRDYIQMKKPNKAGSKEVKELLHLFFQKPVSSLSEQIEFGEEDLGRQNLNNEIEAQTGTIDNPEETPPAAEGQENVPENPETPEAHEVGGLPPLNEVPTMDTLMEFMKEGSPDPKIDEDRLILGSTLLGDVNMVWISFFAQKQFFVGQSIIIEFMVPNKFSLNAEIVFCKNYNMGSRVISTAGLKYRLVAKFTFLRPGERTLLRRFATAIQPSILPASEGEANPHEETDALSEIA